MKIRSTAGRHREKKNQGSESDLEDYIVDPKVKPIYEGLDIVQVKGEGYTDMMGGQEDVYIRSDKGEL